jgi:hypothetical protein
VAVHSGGSVAFEDVRIRHAFEVPFPLDFRQSCSPRSRHLVRPTRSVERAHHDAVMLQTRVSQNITSTSRSAGPGSTRLTQPFHPSVRTLVESLYTAYLIASVIVSM